MDEQDRILISPLLTMYRTLLDARATIYDYDCADQAIIIKCPFDISGQFQLCNTPHGLYLSINPVSVWCGARGTEDYRTAINIYVYQKSHRSGQIMTIGELSWSFNAHFFELLYFMMEAEAKNLILLLKWAVRERIL